MKLTQHLRRLRAQVPSVRLYSNTERWFQYGAG